MSARSPITSLIEPLEGGVGSSDKDQVYTLRNDSGDKGWYRSWPYAFKANINGTIKIFYLPISPQNINIVTNFATNIIATLYSTVEEHSEVRYYDITIQGTTGIVPKYYKEETYKDGSFEGSKNYRKNYSENGGIIQSDIAGGFMRRTVALAQAAANAASDLLFGRKHEAGVFTDNNGYMAFHNFYRFLLKYKKTAADLVEKQDKPLLVFLNYKDNNEYSCSIQRFSLERSAENPMLYNYTIQMRTYDLKTISSGIDMDKLGGRLTAMGLKDSGKSLAAKLATKVRLAKTGINAARNLVGSVGR